MKAGHFTDFIIDKSIYNVSDIEQRSLINLLEERFSYIIGSPGSGKTYILNKFIEKIPNRIFYFGSTRDKIQFEHFNGYSFIDFEEYINLTPEHSELLPLNNFIYYDFHKLLKHERKEEIEGIAPNKIKHILFKINEIMKSWGEIGVVILDNYPIADYDYNFENLKIIITSQNLTSISIPKTIDNTEQNVILFGLNNTHDFNMAKNIYQFSDHAISDILKSKLNIPTDLENICLKCIYKNQQLHLWVKC